MIIEAVAGIICVIYYEMQIRTLHRITQQRKVLVRIYMVNWINFERKNV